ncbi:hypothetical protein V3C99_015024 [Haemonchus contortus]
MSENSAVPWGDPKRLLKRTGPAFALANTRHYDSHPTDPENDTDIDQCIQRLLDNDPTLKEINMNNMKRTPIPQLRRLLEALAYNEHCERLSLANMGLHDNDLAILMPVLEINTGLKKLNLETNYLSGDFFIKFFQATLAQQTLEEIRATNQGTSFTNLEEKEIVDNIVANTGLIKVSISLRLQEDRNAVEKAVMRNGDLKRQVRRLEAMEKRMSASPRN